MATNDGNAIWSELDLAYPASKSMIKLSRTRDEEVGDGMVLICCGPVVCKCLGYCSSSVELDCGV